MCRIGHNEGVDGVVAVVVRVVCGEFHLYLRRRAGFLAAPTPGGAARSDGLALP